jgi:hypothetical protein
MSSGGDRSVGGLGPVFWLVIATLLLLVAVLQWFLSDQLVVKVLSTVAALCYVAGAAAVWRKRRAQT